MKCMNCGADNQDGVKFCENCGHPLAAQPQQPQQAYQQQPYQQQPYQQQPYQQQPYQQQPYQQQPYQPYPQPGYYAPADPYLGHSMKWYKFLVFFALIASAVVNVANAIISFTSGNYTVDVFGRQLTGADARTWMYAMAPSLKTADIFYGIALLIGAGLLLVTWFYLYKKKALGPKLLYITYAFDAVVAVGYAIWVFAAAKDVLENPTSLISSAIISAIVSIVMIAVNVVYFNKRKDIFVN